MYGFKLSTIRNNTLLYIIFGAVCLLGIAQQIFLPYFIIYFEFFVGITDYAILLGIVLTLASIVSVVGGRLVDRYGRKKFLVSSVFFYLFVMFFLFFFEKSFKDNII